MLSSIFNAVTWIKDNVAKFVSANAWLVIPLFIPLAAYAAGAGAGWGAIAQSWLGVLPGETFADVPAKVAGGFSNMYHATFG